MDNRRSPDLAGIAAYAARAGLSDSTEAELERLTVLAERVAGQVASVGRVPRKSDEPAHVFRVGRGPRTDR